MAIFCQIAIFALLSLCIDFKHFLTKLLLVEYYGRPITHLSWKSVSGLVQVRQCPYLRDYIEIFQVSLIGFQNLFLFLAAVMTLEAWKVEFERGNSFCITM